MEKANVSNLHHTGRPIELTAPAALAEEWTAAAIHLCGGISAFAAFGQSFDVGQHAGGKLPFIACQHSNVSFLGKVPKT